MGFDGGGDAAAGVDQQVAGRDSLGRGEMRASASKAQELRGGNEIRRRGAEGLSGAVVGKEEGIDAAAVDDGEGFCLAAVLVGVIAGGGHA